jgi:hypothetical protein
VAGYRSAVAHLVLGAYIVKGSIDERGMGRWNGKLACFILNNIQSQAMKIAVTPRSALFRHIFGQTAIAIVPRASCQIKKENRHSERTRKLFGKMTGQSSRKVCFRRDGATKYPTHSTTTGLPLWDNFFSFQESKTKVGPSCEVITHPKK